MSETGKELRMKPSTRASMLLLLGIAACAGFFWLGRSTQRVAEDSGRIIKLEHDNQALKAELDKLRASIGDEQEPPDHLRLPRGGPATGTPSRREAPDPLVAEELRTLRDTLAAANKTIEEWQVRAADVQSQLDQLREEQKRLASLEADLRQQLAASKQLAEAKDAELTRKNDELAQLEAANKRLRNEAEAAGQKASQLLQTSNELQELYRRRESYLNTLVGRYREVTEQYRAFASVLENRRGPEGTAGGGISIAGPELSRIQSSINMAEEDLRQLNTLNAQALRLQKKLGGR